MDCGSNHSYLEFQDYRTRILGKYVILKYGLRVVVFVIFTGESDSTVEDNEKR